jgi:N-acetylmuramoyl-L-alanine amidase
LSAARGVGRRALLRGGGSLVLLLGAGELAWGASIVAVRVWPASEYTRVTIESDAALSARHFLVENPQRIVIDVDGLELSPTLRELVGRVLPGDPYIAGVRVGQNQPRVVRLVIDLKQPVAPQVFTLEPVAAYQHRLVFDLYPTRERDPLLALIQEKAAEDRSKAAGADVAERAASEVNDALGEFIGRMGERPAAPTPPGAAPEPGPAPAKPAPKVPRPSTERLVIVALDPGHGGEDPGAVGPSGLREKDVVLAVAQQLRERINEQPNMRAMMTRDADFFVPLHERVHKARRVQADLFISIHADAFIRPEARGASVFALSERGATSVEARWLAQKENAADLVGGANFTHRDSAVTRALLDMSTTAQIRDSLRLGTEVLSHIGRVGRLHKREVEQAGFAVLKAPDVPSILVETAFISNPDEEAKLRDPDYRAELVEALLKGVLRYFAKNPPLARNRPLS